MLRGIDLRSRPGARSRLVGPSGAGKSTIAGLVSRLYDPTGGAVRLGGVDLRDTTLAAVSETVGVVSQDVHLFHEPLATNLRYAKPDATDAELEAALREAQVWDVVAALPDGYDTIVGERGYRLSGGEKQRIAIARVLLKDPGVVVLDEATAHLDAASEEKVQAALQRVLEGRTSVVIAHRLSTIRDADEIAVIDGGMVGRARHPRRPGRARRALRPPQPHPVQRLVAPHRRGRRPRPRGPRRPDPARRRGRTAGLISRSGGPSRCRRASPRWSERGGRARAGPRPVPARRRRSCARRRGA